jgi:hypothetical protein
MKRDFKYMIYTKTKKELIKLKRMLEMSNFGGGK